MCTRFVAFRVALQLHRSPFETFLNAWTLSSTMAHPPQWEYSNNDLSMKTERQRCKSSAQHSTRQALQNDMLCCCQCQKTIERPSMEQAFQNALIILKRHFHVRSQCQGKHLRPRLFWSHWSLIRRDKWKRKRLERSCFHWETSLETFQQSILKCSRALTLFFIGHFKCFKHFNLKRNLTWHFRPCF